MKSKAWRCFYNFCTDFQLINQQMTWFTKSVTESLMCELSLFSTKVSQATVSVVIELCTHWFGGLCPSVSSITFTLGHAWCNYICAKLVWRAYWWTGQTLVDLGNSFARVTQEQPAGDAWRVAGRLQGRWPQSGAQSKYVAFGGEEKFRRVFVDNIISVKQLRTSRPRKKGQLGSFGWMTTNFLTK